MQSFVGNPGERKPQGLAPSMAALATTGYGRHRAGSVPVQPDPQCPHDNILDFSVVDDTILLSHLVFTALGSVGTLPAGGFFTGATAGDAGDRIIYNSSTGALLYDADGTGAAALCSSHT